MREQKFGRNGPQVSVIGQGTWYIDHGDRKTAVAALRRGIDLGMTHIDTAEMYGDAELVIADAIAGQRDKIFLVSKVLPSNASRRGTITACERSLKRLRTDRLDCLIDTGISPNGLVLDPTETVLFVAMMRDNAVWRVPLMKDGSVSKVGRFCSTFGASGPDGLTMDKAGRLFVAHASLGHVFVFAPNGELIARIKSCAGASCTNVAIGGPNRDRLYVTESATGTVLVADIGGSDSAL